MQPINYMQGYQNPLETILGQVRAFQDFSQNANVLASQREQNRITTAHNDRRIQAMKELQSIDFGDENALRAFHGRYGDLEYGQGLKSYFDNLDEKRKKAEIGQLSQVYSALRNNRPNVAKEYLLAQATAYENAGDKVNADGARQMVQMIETDPQMALQNVAFHYAYAVPKEASENYERLLKAQKPDLQIQNAGGYLQGIIQDPVTGEVTTQELGNITQSADNVADNQTKIAVEQMGNDTQRYVSDNSLKGSMYSADKSAEASMYGADQSTQRTLAEIEAEKQKAEIREVGGRIYRVYSDGSADDLGPVAPKPMTSGSREKVAEIQGDSDKINQTISSLQKALDLSEQGIYDGYFANDRADFMGNFGGTEESRRTQEYMNIITNSALQSMKSIFGGNPTEGERAMLLKVQASASYPIEVRRAILSEAIDTMKNRLKSNQNQMSIIMGQNGQSVSQQTTIQQAPQHMSQQPEPQGNQLSSQQQQDIMRKKFGE